MIDCGLVGGQGRGLGRIGRHDFTHYLSIFAFVSAIGVDFSGVNRCPLMAFKSVTDVLG